MSDYEQDEPSTEEKIVASLASRAGDGLKKYRQSLVKAAAKSKDMMASWKTEVDGDSSMDIDPVSQENCGDKVTEIISDSMTQLSMAMEAVEQLREILGPHKLFEKVAGNTRNIELQSLLQLRDQEVKNLKERIRHFESLPFSQHNNAPTPLRKAGVGFDLYTAFADADMGGSREPSNDRSPGTPISKMAQQVREFCFFSFFSFFQFFQF
jgi:hypothetical protein